MPFRFNPLTANFDWTDPIAAESDPVFEAWKTATPPLYSVTCDSPLSGAGTAASHLTVDLSSKQNADAGLTSLAGLTYASASFVKMTGADTFTLDTNTYLTSQTSHADVLVDGDFSSQGIMLRGASSGTYSILTDSSTNWNTAYGWGNHASAGYLTSLSGALLTTGATTGATSQAQVFTNTLQITALTASKVVFSDADKKLTSTGIGLSSQFIKGDGSLDSSTYLTSVTAHNLLSATHGDTTAASCVRGDIVIGSGVSPTWTRLAVGASGTYLAGGTEPAWATLNQAAVSGLTTADSPTFTALNLSATSNQIVLQSAGVTTTLTESGATTNKTITFPNFTGTLYISGGTDVAVADGGTGRSTSTTAYGVICAGTTATGALQTTASAGLAGQALLSGGAGALPAYTTATFPTTATTTGAYLRADGTNWITSTLVLPNAGTAYRLPVFSATNTMTELAAVGATGEYLKGNTGAIPSWATLNQAAISGLTTASSPAFVTVKLSNLTDGYLPYHVSDASGLANSPVYTDGTNVGINITTPAAMLSLGASVDQATGKLLIYDDGTYIDGLGIYVGEGLRIFGDNYNKVITFGYQTKAGAFTEGMRLVNSNLGIGAVPTTRLSVYAAGASPDLADLTKGILAIRTDTGTSGVQLNLGGYVSGSYGMWMQSAYGGSAYQLLLNPLGGDVGVGIAAATSRLHVYDSVDRAAPMLFLQGYYPASMQRIERPTGGIASSILEAHAKNTSTGLSTLYGLVGVYGSVESGVTPPSLGYMYFGADTDADASKNTIRLYPGQIANFQGDVGINETSPDYLLDINGAFGFTPGNSVTPVDNGDVVIEATNNTTLTFRLKGSDGTVRSGTLTLA